MKISMQQGLWPPFAAFSRFFMPLFFICFFSTCSGGQKPNVPAKVSTRPVPVATAASLSDTTTKALETTIQVDSSALAKSIAAKHHNALRGIVILVDAGHGGAQQGAHFGSVEEKNVTLAVAIKLRARLQAMGARVYMTRVRDTDITLEQRVNQSIALRPDIFISVHANANYETAEYGIETYYFGQRSAPLARTLLNSISQGLQEKANWVQKDRLFVLHHNIVPSTLEEIGYLSNQRTKALLITDSYQERTAEAITVGVFNYFQLPHVARGCNLSQLQIASVIDDMKDGLAHKTNYHYHHKKKHHRV